MLKLHKAYYHSEIGLLEVAGTETGIVSVRFLDDYEKTEEAGIHPCLIRCLTQLDEYFKGVRKEFSLELQLDGTDFQKRVWQELQKIPYGRTASYQEVAAAIGRTKAVRAVGNANRLNRIPIIIPCHRVVGKNGSLVGYAAGLWRKEWLLRHEESRLCTLRRR